LSRESSSTSRPEKRFPHIFLDKNALVRLLLSITRHLRNDDARKTLVRFLAERGLLTFMATRSSTDAALGIIVQRSLAPFDIAYRELDSALKRGWIILVDAEENAAIVSSDQVRSAVAERLGSYWSNLLKDMDPEDAEQLKWAAKAYALSCIVRRSDGYYVPTYMLVVSDNHHMQRVHHLINLLAVAALKELQQDLPLRLYRVKKFVSVASWDSFREMLENVVKQGRTKIVK